ncbi:MULTISPECIES: DNA methyltransferase [Cryobacterium]|uniref:DNA methyltransferase n=1 Tax=Cryobacterium TaxID=69578 RepID=UPI001F54432E|nr:MULTISPECIES: DNA methyltransferase [Cryobacterium]
MTEELSVGRSDPTYMAHAYLTKVPTPAIRPFIEAYSVPGGIVVDPFAGSGMTGVAAAMLGRKAHLSDISVLGQHIGRNFVNLVDKDYFLDQAAKVIAASKADLGDIYSVECAACGQDASLTKAVWSAIVECTACKKPVNYYRSMEAANWRKPDMVCPDCHAPVSTRNPRLGEEPVLDSINSKCSATLLDQEPSGLATKIDLGAIPYPHVEITADRQMYRASALGKSGRTTIASFYSPRNLAVLATLRRHIGLVPDAQLRGKLLFAFTACLTRASKRYQWSKQRPLNAANANYYVAPVFYEWNVYELFARKIAAVLKSDEHVRAKRRQHVSSSELETPDVTYDVGSAETLSLADNSADYVFTDPPFGSNLFYADMALFQEAWLEGFTDVDQEAVVDRTKGGKRTADRYEMLLTGALAECNRVVRPGGHISMVFGNSSGSMWSLVQRSIANAGLMIEPEKLVVLNKGQRSVKGLASGFEDVATLDLIITMRASNGASTTDLKPVGRDTVATRIRELAEASPATPSHLYLELLRAGIREGWELDRLDLRDVTSALLDDGWDVDSKSGRLSKSDAEEVVISA